MTDALVIVFVKNIKLGTVKTRLAKTIGLNQRLKRDLSIGLKNLRLEIGGIRKFKNYLRGWLKKYSLLQLFCTNLNC